MHDLHKQTRRSEYKKHRNANSDFFTLERGISIGNKIEKINTWLQELQESPENISSVLQNIDNFFSEERNQCEIFLNMTNVSFIHKTPF